MIDKLKLLTKLKDLHPSWSAVHNSRPASVESLTISPGDRMRVEVVFTQDGLRHTIHGEYDLHDTKPDTVQFDGQDVEEDDIDFDVLAPKMSWRGISVPLQFEFRFTQRKAQYEFRATSRLRVKTGLAELLKSPDKLTSGRRKTG